MSLCLRGLMKCNPSGLRHHHALSVWRECFIQHQLVECQRNAPLLLRSKQRCAQLTYNQVRYVTFEPPDTYHARRRSKIRDGIMYMVSLILFMVGVSFAAVPLYKVFCSATGYSGTTQRVGDEKNEKMRNMKPLEWRPITVHFSGNTSTELEWDFEPVLSAVKLVPGETCLAFFTAKNNTDRVITGISTYNVTPFEAGAYFNKIQCFCFDEQTLNPGEELDMPVFFYIDPDFVLDTDLLHIGCKDISLHYTFFDTLQSTNNNPSPLVELARNLILPLFYGKGEPEQTTVEESSIVLPEGAVRINSGVYKTVVRKGWDKEFVYEGATVVVNVTGMIEGSGKVFWSTNETGQRPFVYKAGVGQVIKGWDEGCLGMSEGEISRITMSAEKGYGKQGNPTWGIPPGTELTFEIEIMSVK